MKALPALFGSILLAACAQSGADEPQRTGEVSRTLDAERRSGPLVIHVDDDAAPGGDGSGRFPFDDIADAIALAGSLDSAVVVVEPGRYEVSSTLRIQSPIDLRGSNVMQIDSAGFPTGAIAPGTETSIVGMAALGTAPVVSVGPSDDGILHGVEIRKFTFEPGPQGGDDLNFNRTQGYRLSDNAIVGLAATGIFSVASSGRIAGNYISVNGTGAIVAAGYPASPSTVELVGNRAVHNRVGGVLFNGSTFRVPETGDQLDVLVRDNDLSENTAQPNSFGLRIFMIRRDLGLPGDDQSSGNVKATIQGNRILGNAIGVTIDAGFPYRSDESICDPRVYSGTFDLELRGNTLSGSRRAPALIAFTRNTTAIDQSELPEWQYLHSAIYDISDVDGTLADAWIEYPERDPYIGPCPNDATQELLDNALIYNGTVLPNETL